MKSLRKIVHVRREVMLCMAFTAELSTLLYTLSTRKGGDVELISRQRR